MKWREWRYVGKRKDGSAKLIHMFNCEHPDIRPALRVEWIKPADASLDHADEFYLAERLGYSKKSVKLCDTLGGCTVCRGAGCGGERSENERYTPKCRPAASIVLQCPDCGHTNPDCTDAEMGDPEDLPLFSRRLMMAGPSAFGPTISDRTDDWEFQGRYNAYLESPEWAARRSRVMERADGTCEACLLEPAAQVHHLTYDHVFDEPLFDLAAVCAPCHERITAIDKGEA